MILGNDPILLTPGPLTTSLATKQAMLRDWGSWDAAFNQITASICRDLVDISRYYFVNAMTTISAVVFLYSPKTTLAAISILHLDEAGNVGAAAAMATLIVATSAVVTAVFFMVEWALIHRTQAWRRGGRT